MAVYKLFPSKDAFIYTEEAKANTGYDEILELNTYPKQAIGQTSRILIQFADSEIDDLIGNIINGSNYTASINLSLASATETFTSYTINAYPLSKAWDEGVGKALDNPVNKTGASWEYAGINQTNAWITSSYATNETGSYSSNFPGGGNWYTGSGGDSLEFSYVHEAGNDLDLVLDVTTGVAKHYADEIANNGFIIKFQDSVEFEETASFSLKYFSRNTNTIYPPCLEFKWDDSSYSTGSLSVLNSSESDILLVNNTGNYINDGKKRFRLHSRPKYPTRTFSTASLYRTNYALPSGSYYAIKDENTEELVINYDTLNTKVSCDSTGPYFDIYMKGLEPERYYRVLIKTVLDGTTTIVNDHRNVFKVVRNG